MSERINIQQARKSALESMKDAEARRVRAAQDEADHEISPLTRCPHCGKSLSKED